jgi:hypothetical protein
MKKLVSGTVSFVCVLLALLAPHAASAYGFQISVDCEYGNGVAPDSLPDPNIACELTWEQTGPPRVNKVSWTGLLIVLANPAIKDTFATGKMDMRYTTQPQAKYVYCTDVPGIHQMTAYATSWENEGHGGGFALYQQASDIRSGEIQNTHPCTPP